MLFLLFEDVWSVSSAVGLHVEVLAVEAVSQLSGMRLTLSMSSLIWNYWAIGLS
jgi:hypothetical protein